MGGRDVDLYDSCPQKPRRFEFRFGGAYTTASVTTPDFLHITRSCDNVDFAARALNLECPRRHCYKALLLLVDIVVVAHRQRGMAGWNVPVTRICEDGI